MTDEKNYIGKVKIDDTLYQINNLERGNIANKTASAFGLTDSYTVTSALGYNNNVNVSMEINPHDTKVNVTTKYDNEYKLILNKFNNKGNKVNEYRCFEDECNMKSVIAELTDNRISKNFIVKNNIKCVSSDGIVNLRGEVVGVVDDVKTNEIYFGSPLFAIDGYNVNSKATYFVGHAFIYEVENIDIQDADVYIRSHDKSIEQLISTPSGFTDNDLKCLKIADDGKWEELPYQKYYTGIKTIPMYITTDPKSGYSVVYSACSNWHSLKNKCYIFRLLINTVFTDRWS